MHPVKGDTYR
jgi:hypothetical protein